MACANRLGQQGILANVAEVELDKVFAILGCALLVHGRYSFVSSVLEGFTGKNSRPVHVA
jgi:hypothetical protein